MGAALRYAGRKGAYRIAEFFRHWYVKSAKIYSNFVLNRLERLDYVLAWRITARHLFEPLYRDYSVVGYALGFLFRLFRLGFASILYAAIFAAALAGYVVWMFIPPLLLVIAVAPSLL